MSYKISLSLFVGVLSLGAVTTVQADGRRDLYTQQAQQRYYPQQQNARTFGMAGSSVVTSSDSSSVVGNPAGLGLMWGGDFSGTYSNDTLSGNEHPSYREVEEDRNIGQTLLALPLGPVTNGTPDFGNVGLGWTGFNSDYGDDTFNTKSNGYRVTGAYALGLTDTLSFGYSLSYYKDSLRSDLYDYSMNDGFRHTFGVSSIVSDALTVGASFFFGNGDHATRFKLADAKFGSDTDSSGFELGAAYKLSESTLVAVSGDYQHFKAGGDILSSDPEIVPGGKERGDTFAVRVGVEQLISDYLTARAGYRFQANTNYHFSRPELEVLNGSATYNAWTLGLGLKLPIDGTYIKSVNLDYGVEYRSVGYQDWQHVVTLSTPFDLCS